MSEPVILILNPATERKAIPDAYEVTAACGHRCWLSPGSQEAFLAVDVISKCLDCVGGTPAMVKMLLDGTATSADPQELIQALRRELGLE